MLRNVTRGDLITQLWVSLLCFTNWILQKKLALVLTTDFLGQHTVKGKALQLVLRTLSAALVPLTHAFDGELDLAGRTASQTDAVVATVLLGKDWFGCSLHHADFCLREIDPMTNSRNCTCQQSSVNCRDRCACAKVTVQICWQADRGLVCILELLK